MPKSQRSKDNYLVVDNPYNLRLRWTFAKCTFCPGRLFPFEDPITDGNGNVIYEETINIDLTYWDKFKVSICDHCVLCVRAIYD